MHGTLRRLHGGRRAHGTTLDRFRLNELVSQAAFASRRARCTGGSPLLPRCVLEPRSWTLDAAPGTSCGNWQRRLSQAAGSPASIPRASRDHLCAAARRAGLAAGPRAAGLATDLHRRHRAGPAAAGHLV